MKPQVTEQTAKRWKLAQLVGVLLIVAGSVAGMIAAQSESATGSGFAVLAFLFGLPTWIAGRFGAWWYHG